MRTKFSVFHSTFISILEQNLIAAAKCSVYQQTELGIIKNLRVVLRSLSVNLDLTQTPIVTTIEDREAYQQLQLALDEVSRTQSLSRPFLQAWDTAISRIKQYVAHVYPCLSEVTNKSSRSPLAREVSLLPPEVGPSAGESKPLLSTPVPKADESREDSTQPFLNAYTRQRAVNLLSRAIDHITVTKRTFASSLEQEILKELDSLIVIVESEGFKEAIIPVLIKIKKYLLDLLQNEERREHEKPLIDALQQIHQLLLLTAIETCPAFRAHHEKFLTALLAAQMAITKARCCTAWTVIGCLLASVASGCCVPFFSCIYSSNGTLVDDPLVRETRDDFGLLVGDVKVKARYKDYKGDLTERCEGAFTAPANRRAAETRRAENLGKVLDDSYMLHL